MAEKRVVQTVFQYIVDKSSLDQSIRTQSNVVKLLGETSKQALSVEDAAKKVNRELAEMARQKGVQQIADEFAQATREGHDTADALERVAQQLSAIGASDSEIQSVVRNLQQMRGASAGGAGVSDRFGTVSTGFGALASGAEAFGIGGEGARAVGDIAGAAEQLPMLVSTIGQLGPVGLAAAAGVGALLGAGKLYLDSIQRQSKALGELVASQERYYELLRDGTTEDARAALEEAQQNLADLRTQRAEVQRELDAQFAASQEQTLGDLGARIRTAVRGISDEGFKAAQERLGELDTQIAESTGLINRLTPALENNTFATNDLIEAQEAAAEAAAELSGRINDIQLGVLIDSATLTKDQLDARLTALDVERKAIESLIESGAVSGEQLGTYRDRLVEIGTETGYLITQAGPLVEAREREAQALERFSTALDAGLEGANKLGKGVLGFVSAASKAGDALEKSNQAITKIASDLLTKQGEALNRRDTALSEASRAAENARTEAQRKAQMDRQLAEVQHQQNLAKIQRDFNRAAATAISDRNVVAYLAAKQQRDDAAADEKQAYDNRKKEIDRNLAETNRQIALRLQEQQRLAVQRYQAELQTALQAAQAARNLEMQKQQELLRIQQQAIQQQVNVVSQGMRAIGQAITSVFSQTQKAVLSTAARAVGSLLGSATGNPLLRLASGIRIPGFDVGAKITQTGIANVHKDELILNRQQQQALGLSRDSLARGGGAPNISISINGLGMSKRQLMGEIERQLGEAVEGFTA